MELTKRGFEEIEGRFHDGLGTYAELVLANELIHLQSLRQAPFDIGTSQRKMLGAIEQLPSGHQARAVFEREIANINRAAHHAAGILLEETRQAHLVRVRHTAAQYSGGVAGDILLEFELHPPLPVSVKTDKSGKVAVADGQTSDISVKWAERYFRVTADEFAGIMRQLGYQTMSDLKAHYLNAAELVAQILIYKLGLTDCSPTDFSRARPTDLEAVKYLFRQLLTYKRGSDGSRVLIFQRSTGEVKWETLLDAVDIDALTLDQVTLRPSRPRAGRRIGSEFGIKVDARAVVTFQIKHRRGTAHGTERHYEFLDITTRLIT